MNTKIYWAGETYDTATIDEKSINRTIELVHTINHTNPQIAPSQYTSRVNCSVEKIGENTYKLRYNHYDGALSPDCINKIYLKDVKIMLNMDDEEVEKLCYPVRTDFNRAYIHYETFMEAFQRRSREAGATEARYISIAVEQYSIELTLYFEPLY